MRRLAFLFPPKSELATRQVLWGLAWRLVIVAFVAYVIAGVIWAEYVDEDQAHSTGYQIGQWVGAGLFYVVLALIITSPIWATAWLVLWLRARRRRLRSS